MRGNSGVAHSQEPFRNDSGYFKAVEALQPRFSENSSHRALDPGCPESSKEHYFYLPAMKKKFQPARWIFRSMAKPSSPWTTLHLPE